jgi:hypothetical protein
MFRLYSKKNFFGARVQLYLHIIAALTPVPIKQQAISQASSDVLV